MKKALIDGDIVVYQVASAAENAYYLINDLVKVKYKREVDQFALERGVIVENLRVERRAEPAQDSEVIEALISRIESIVDRSGCDDFEVFLSGRGSFRKRMYPAYKANRTDVKPSKYDLVRDVLLNNGATEVEHIEADDALGIAHTEDQENTVICSIDKDLLMIPGNHYNWNKDEKFVVYPNEAGYNFFLQLLTGDRTDNICGLKGVGKYGAEKVLKGIESAEDALRRVERAYVNHFSTSSLTEVDEVLYLNANLLWIKRSPNSVWDDVLETF